MVASLMVIGAAPASAAVDTTDACPATIPSAGFTDISGFDATTQRAINCLADYNITQGTSATTYSPNMDVTRWQMALFLTRQAGVHDITLPSGAPQGFTDISGLDNSTQVAINQLAQLEITQGTSATMFSPHEPVTRWQMALFLTRLATAAGLTLPSGAPQGFTDLGGLSNEAQVAINQLAQLDIADGTSATTFSPFMNVNRWQMALFLTRTLAVDNVTPEVSSQVSVTPTTAVTLGQGQARAYQASFFNSDGSPYTGQVGVLLAELDTDDSPSYDIVAGADNATIVQVDGVAVGAAEFNGFPGLDGKITFTVTGTATAEETIPVVWIDSDGDGSYEVTTDVTPTEPFALGGMITFTGAPVAEAVVGAHANAVVSGVNTAGNSFVADDDAHAAETFNYDDADIFLIGGSLSDVTAFEAALTVGDTVQVTNYDPSEPTAANTTTYNLTNNTDPASALVVTSPATTVERDQATFGIQGTGQAGQIVAIYIDADDDGVKDAGEVKVGETTVAANGTWAVNVPLTQNSANNFVATTRATAATNDDGTGVNVPTITEGAPAAATIASTVGANVAPSVAGELGPNDTITITFSEAVTGVGNGDTIAIQDTDGSTATLTLGPDVGFALNGTNTVLTLTINTLVFASGGTDVGIDAPAQITSISGFTGADGLAINVTGSGGGRVFTGF